MGELLWGLYNLILATAFGRWFELERTGKVSPFAVSLFYFLFAMECLAVVLISDVATTKLCFSAFGSFSVLISILYRLDNNHEKYQQGAGVWIADLGILMGVTGYLMMAMDYANTKRLLNVTLLGAAGGIVTKYLKRWRGKERE